ncbi:hypothetical protein Goshw_005405 [Gossypium schwendimanii]|uniref:Aminotransferase-like plant mobile domain-containing protein n=1 Tax=Gossypium schwendimanii TaxID=34291 RepID=A0A7J9MG48_GOSSC|nr:hypothetical protein [Gossypium schwendimanii]
MEDLILQCHIRNLPGPPSPLIETYLREVGFLHVALVDWGCKLDPKLISALVEKHSIFHTLVVTGSVQSAYWGIICYDLLGVVPKTIYGSRIEMTWGMAMPDKSRHIVHLRWLLKLVDFRGGDELSWGSTMLVTLYWEMCRATQPEKIKIGGCLLQLQYGLGIGFHFYVLE